MRGDSESITFSSTEWYELVLADKRQTDRIAQLEAELAKEKGGWDAFYKLRKSVGEERYPGLTGEVKASSAETKVKQGDLSEKENG